MAADKTMSDSGLEGAFVILERVRDDGSPKTVLKFIGKITPAWAKEAFPQAYRWPPSVTWEAFLF